MTLRTFGALLGGAVLVLTMQTDLAQAQKTLPTPDVTNLNTSRSNIYRQGNGATKPTVKSSKSNTSDRMGGGGGKAAASRMGGGGGAKGGANRTNLNSSRSN